MNSQPSPKQALFKDRWQSYCSWVSELNKNAGKSSMWQGLIDDFNIRTFPDDPSRELFRPKAFRGYNFYSKRHENFGFAVKRALLSFAYFFARAANLIRNRIWQINVGGLSVEQFAFHPAGLHHLQGLGLRQGLDEFCNRFGLSPYSATGVKAYYIGSKLLTYISTIENPRVIEIGGGFGNLAAVLHHKHPVRQYVIVDLPEMILHSSLALQTYFPEQSFYFLHPGSADRYDPNQPGFYFCVPESMAQLSDSTFDLGFNIDSFQEMTEPQVAGYLQLMQRVLRQDAHLINLNRRKYLAAERYDNNPLLYPYHPGNRVVQWETDFFMDRVFNFDRVRLESWLWRAEKINKS